MDETVQRGDEDRDHYLEGLTFEELAIGRTATATHRLADVEAAEAAAGDEAAAGSEPAEQGLRESAAADLVWRLIAAELPGPGTTWVHRELDFHGALAPRGEVTVSVEVAEKDRETGHVVLACECADEQGNVALSGRAVVVPPRQRVRRRRSAAPKTPSRGQRGDRLREIIDAASALAPLPMAVVHPVDAASLAGAARAAEAGLVEPLLVGPERRIRRAAEEAEVDIEGFPLFDTEHSHESARRAVGLVRSGEARALLKGKLHTDELMDAVLAAEAGLRTGRRISHVFVMDVPDYDRPLLITDAAVNIAPSLDDKVDILRNAIDLALALGIREPRAAILCAVETVSSSMPCTVEAAALCKMADRGQIDGARVDGPLAFDNAVDLEAARTKGIRSEVAGRANILLAPDLEAGNMLAKQLEYMAGAQAAGIVVGARVPVALTSRADDEISRMASCAVASLLLARQQETDDER